MPEMTEREQVLRDLVADLREECAEKDEQIETLRKLIADIKAWDVDQLITLPLALRKRMQAVLDNEKPTGI